jgi:hypothetical protein
MKLNHQDNLRYFAKKNSTLPRGRKTYTESQGGELKEKYQPVQVVGVRHKHLNIGRHVNPQGSLGPA